MVNKKLNIHKRKNINIPINKNQHKKLKQKEEKVGDIVSCITFLSKNEKIQSDNKKGLLSAPKKSNSPYYENSFKRKKKYISGSESDASDALDNVFNDEKQSKKIILNDFIISNDKKYVYEDELSIERNDALVLNGKICKDAGTLEIHVFNYEEDIFNIYNDVILDNYPICIDTVNKNCYENKNIVAVGTLSSNIGLWDINNIDTLEPLSYLGNDETNIEHLMKKRKKKHKEQVETEQKKYDSILDGHTNSITSINSSKLINNMLCSGSKDCTIKLWDLNRLSNIHTYTFHKKKINNVSFHLQENNILFSTSSDNTLKIYDIRKNTIGLNIKLQSTHEFTIWNKYDEHVILSSDVNGYINKFDIRNIKSSKLNETNEFRFKAFNESCVSLLCPYYKNLVLAGSESGVIKAYDFSKFEENKPLCVYTKNTKKKLFYMKDNEDCPSVVFLGSDKLYDWNISLCEQIYKHFQ